MNDNRGERGRIIHFVFEVILKLVQKENEVNEVDVKLSVVCVHCYVGQRKEERGKLKNLES